MSKAQCERSGIWRMSCAKGLRPNAISSSMSFQAAYTNYARNLEPQVSNYILQAPREKLAFSCFDTDCYTKSDLSGTELQQKKRGNF